MEAPLATLNFDLQQDGFVQLTFQLSEFDREMYEFATRKKIVGAIMLTRYIDKVKVKNIEITIGKNTEIMDIAEFHKSYVGLKLFSLSEVRALLFLLLF